MAPKKRRPKPKTLRADDHLLRAEALLGAAIMTEEQIKRYRRAGSHAAAALYEGDLEQLLHEASMHEVAAILIRSGEIWSWEQVDAQERSAGVAS